MRARTLGVPLLLAGLLPASALGETDWRADGRAALAQARALEPIAGPGRNVILFLGDGMDATTVTAARILEGQRRGGPGEENLLAFERLPWISLSKTYNTDQQVPDSAGTITAILTGVKTRAGSIGVDSSVPRGNADAVAGHRLPTLLGEAERRGLATGIVTTSRVTHATPAGAYAHVPERGWEDDSSLPEAAREADFPDIARQLVEFPHGDGIDVVLGGGRARFLPRAVQDPEYPERRGRRDDRRNLVEEWRKAQPNSRFVWKQSEFAALSPDETDRLLGLFEPSHMQFEVDRAADPAGEPSLAEMTATALAILSRNPRGYVLLVEGGRIDHAHHQGNAYRALSDTVAFSDAVRVAAERTSPADTLIVVTADHGHVITMGGYPVRGNPILGKVRTRSADGGTRTAQDGLGLPYTTLAYGNGPGYTGATLQQPEGPKLLAPSVTGQEGVTKGRPDLDEVDTEAPDYLQEAAVPLSSETHSGVDVPVYARGPAAHLLHGVQEQSYLYYVMVHALGWDAQPGKTGKTPDAR